MAREIIDIGTQGNDGTGDSIRESFRKVNENFTQLFAIFGTGDRIAFRDLDDTPDSFPNGIPRGDAGTDADKVVVSNEDADALVAKALVGGEGILVDHTDENEIRIISTGGRLINDDKPVLGNHLNGNSFAIGNISDPSAETVDLFNALHNTTIQEDDLVMSRGYADRRYVQTGGQTGVGSRIRVRSEPETTDEYSLDIDSWDESGYAVVTSHGFNTAVNGAEFIYNNDGNSPATGLVSGNTYAIRYYDSDRLGIYATRAQAIDDVNFATTRIVVNIDPTIPKDIYNAEPSSIAGTGNASTFTFTNVNIVTVTGTGVGAKANITKTNTDLLYSSANITIEIVDQGNEEYQAGDQLKILGTSLGGTTPGEDLTFSLVTEYRGGETLVDAAYDPTLFGKWISDEALPRKSVVRRQGDNMEGPLYLFDHPGSLAGLGTPFGEDDLQAATKLYVDNSSYASTTNLYVATTGSDDQLNTPEDKQGRAYSYAYATIGKACEKAEEIIRQSLSEPGPYRQTVTYGSNAYSAYINEVNPGSGRFRTLRIFTDGQGVDQSRNIENRDLREGSIFKGFKSGATGKVISYEGVSGVNDVYVVELLHDTKDVTYFETGYFDAARKLETNVDFIKAEVVLYLNSKPSTVAYNEEKCARDVGLIVEAMRKDILYGGNANTIKAAKSYRRGATLSLPTEQLTQTLDGINYIESLLTPILGNSLIATTSTAGAFGKRGTVAQDVTGNEGEPEVYDLIEKLFYSLTDIIANGTATSGLPLEFIEGETLEFGQPVPETQILVQIESGVYYEQFPIRVPSNVSIRGEEFRRVIIRPAAGQSLSPWSSIYFYRDDEFDGLKRDYISDAGAASSAQATTTGASGTGAVATLTFAPQASIPFPDGTVITVTGVTPSEYNGTYTVITGTTSSVSFASTATEAQTVAGTIKGTVVTLSSGNVTGLAIGMYMTVLSGTGKFQQLTRISRFRNTTSFEIDKVPEVVLSGAEIRGLNSSNLAPTGHNFGYHYLTDPTGLNGIFDNTITKSGGHTSAATTLLTNKSSIVSQVISYIDSTYPDLEYDSATCARDVGYIVEALAYDITEGGFERSLAAGYAYKRNPSARYAITTQLTETLAGIARINTVVQPLLTADPVPAAIVADLIEGIQNVIIGIKNPPKENKDMDVFLMNDGTILRNITCQGHGGFMMVLDPEGQIQTKSPYAQTCTSLSGSVNEQAYRGGKLIDGFVGNLPARVTAASGTPQTTLTLSGLNVRGIQVPNAFYITGQRYQINVSTYDEATGTAEIVLDDNTPFVDYLKTNIDPAATGLTASSNITSGQYTIPMASTAGLVAGMRVKKSGGSGEIAIGAKIASVTNTSIILDTPHTTTGTLTFDITGIDIIVETPGNRSMLSNDYTQVNDLGYGCICTNNGIAELVSVFTYYNWTSYYSVNGGQIRSAQGNSSYGKYGMRAAGRDPNEVPDPVALAEDTQQVARIYKRGSFAAKNLAGEITLYIDNYKYAPTSVSEIEIDHTNTKSSAVVNTNSNPNNATIVSGGLGYVEEEFIDVVGGTLYPSSSATRIRVTEVDNGTTGGPGIITDFEIIEPGVYSVNPVGGYPTVNGTVSTITTNGVGAGATFNITYLGDIVRYEASNVEVTTSVGDGIDPGGSPGTRTVLKINLNADATSAGLEAPLTNGQLVVVRSLQNFKFTGINVIRPTRPSTALEFTTPSEQGAVYRTLAYTRTSPVEGSLLQQRTISNIQRVTNTATVTVTAPHGLNPGDNIDQIICSTDDSFDDVSITVLSVPTPTSFTYNNPGDNVDPAIAATGTVLFGDTAILTFDTSYNYAIIQTNESKLSDTDYVDGGPKTMGATIGDTRIAVKTIESDTTKARLNSGDLILALAGKTFFITSYVDEDGSDSAYIELSDVAYGDGSIVVGTGLAEALPIVQTTVLRGGVKAETPGEITVNISTCRASGHDFLEIGTGGYNTSNYPSNVFGGPAQPPEPTQEIREETQGRVFYVSTDQDGIFRVGRFFSVDQGTGTVTFSASIALSNLDGIGFKRGTVVKEFSTDVTMTDNADDTVPTESAVRGYIDRRLGITHVGGVVPESQRIPVGSGFLALDGTLPMAGILDMGGGDPATPHRIINVAEPDSDTDAATKGYVDNLIEQQDTFAELKDVGVISTTEGKIPVFTGAGPAIISSSIGGVLSSSVESSVTATLVGGITVPSVTDSGIIGTAQLNVSGGIVVDDITGFPPNGYLRINDEIFSYGAITAVEDRFDNVTRTKFSTAGAIHSAGSTVESLDNSYVNFQIVDGSITNDDVSASAAIVQSKLSMNAATTRANATGITQADRGLASFDSANFEITDGWVGIKAGGVSLAEIQNINANSFLGNLGASSAAPSQITTDTLVLSGINQLFTDFEDGATILSRRENSLKTTSVLNIDSGTPIAGDGTIQVAATTVTGDGYGAVVNVSYTDTPLTPGGPDAPRYTNVTVVNGGNGYAEGNQLKVFGTQLGGTSPANDITFTIASTGSNIDGNVYVGIQKTSITAEPNAVVKTDIDSNLGTAGTRYGNVFATLFDGAVKGNVTGNVTGNLTGNVTGDVSGNAGTVTNGVYTTGSYNDPSWITGLSGAKIIGEITGASFDAGNLLGDTLASNVLNSSLTSVGTLSSLEVSGLVTYSVEDGITTTGTTQAGAYLLTKNINIITTSDIPLPGDEAPGVILPNGTPLGYRIIIRNDTLNNATVYPNDGAQINSLGTNAGFVLNGQTALEFVCARNSIPGVQDGQWYTLNATFA